MTEYPGIKWELFVETLCMHFWLVSKTVLITQHFGYCWTVLAQHQSVIHSPFPTSSPTPQKSKAGGAQEAREGLSQGSWPELTKGIFHTVGYWAQWKKLKERGGKGDISHHGVCLPRTRLCMLSPCFPRSGSTTAHWWEVENKHFILLAYTVLVLCFKLSLSQSMHFSFVSSASCKSEWLCVCLVFAEGQPTTVYFENFNVIYVTYICVYYLDQYMNMPHDCVFRAGNCIGISVFQ